MTYKRKRVKKTIRCALYFICYRHAVGIQKDRSNREFPLCMEHKQFHDFLGEKVFNERFNMWLFSEKVKK